MRDPTDLPSKCMAGDNLAQDIIFLGWGGGGGGGGQGV